MRPHARTTPTHTGIDWGVASRPGAICGCLQLGTTGAVCMLFLLLNNIFTLVSSPPNKNSYKKSWPSTLTEVEFLGGSGTEELQVRVAVKLLRAAMFLEVRQRGKSLLLTARQLSMQCIFLGTGTELPLCVLAIMCSAYVIDRVRWSRLKDHLTIEGSWINHAQTK